MNRKALVSGEYKQEYAGLDDVDIGVDIDVRVVEVAGNSVE